MFNLIRSSYREKKPDKESVINFILFCLLTLIEPIFTLGKFQLSPSDSAEMLFLPNLHYYPGLPPSLLFTLFFFLIFLFLSSLLLLRLKGKTENSRFAFFFYLLVMVLRLVSIFGFPYGETIYRFPDIVCPEILKEIPYSGFSLLERFSTLLNDFCFYSYFYVFYLSIKEVVKKNRCLFYSLFLFINLFALSLILYSVFFEKENLILNIKAFLHGDRWFAAILSYTTNKNIVGFFLFVAFLFNIACFIRKPSLSFVILNLLYIIFLVLIASKTPMMICIFIYIIGFGILYPIFNHREHKGYSLFFSLCFCGLIFLSLLSYFCFKETVFHNHILPLLKGFTDWGTMDARKALNYVGLSMANNNPFAFFFGYNKYPFISLFKSLSSTYDPNLVDPSIRYSSHNSYIDIFLQNGILGLFCCFVIIALYCRKWFVRAYRDHNKNALSVLLGAAALFVYSYSEPRFLFLQEGTCLFFILLAATPYVTIPTREEILKEELTYKIKR